LSAAFTIARTRCSSRPSDPDSFHDPHARITVAAISATANVVRRVGSRRGSVNVRIGRLGSLATMMRQRAFLGFRCCWRIRFRSRDGSLGPRTAIVLLRDGAKVARHRDRARHVVRYGSRAAHAAGPAEYAAGLDPEAARVDVALDLALGEDLEVTRTAHVALDRSGDHDVRAADAPAH